MSRIGRNPIRMPAGVKAELDASNKITVSGPLGKLEQEIDKNITVAIEGDVITLTRANDEFKAKHGLYRALVANMVNGVTKGFEKTLIVKGVGYKLAKQGNKLVLNLGLSHTITLEEPQGVKIEVPSNTEIKVSGIDKQKVGAFAAEIRDLKPVEPYHGYGIRYADEVVVMKQGKTSGKGKK